MAEELEGPDVVGEASPGIDPAAVALALAGASREKADAFLDDQRALIAEQRHHLCRQYIQLDLGIWQQRLGVLLRIATAFIGVAFAGALAWLVWNAANSNNLAIDAFAVPPDLADRGLSGPVLAGKLSDKIAAMQAQTASLRPPRSYANGLSDGLKVEIPETGVSLFELDRFLREKLGHDLHIGGEVVRTDKGVALTVRVGSDGSANVAGADTDVDALLQNLAEAVYKITQPYRYGTWLRSQGRIDEAVAVFQSSASGAPDKERAWNYLGWGTTVFQFQNQKLGTALLQRARALDPNNYAPAEELAAIEYCQGLLQDSQHDYGAALTQMTAHGEDYVLAQWMPGREDQFRAMTFLYQGALLDAAGQMRQALDVGESIVGIMSPAAELGEIHAALHEPGAARMVLAENPVAGPNPVNAGARLIYALHTRLLIALEAQDWPAVLAEERTLPQLLAKYPAWSASRATLFDPPAALALAHLGQFQVAEARLKPTPPNCYPCLLARAQVAASQGQEDRAAYWFARADSIGPAMPFADEDWGAALLARGDASGAIAQFKRASQKGPHFADPLEGWGEALMAQNRSDLAVAKFKDAAQYAPNWGRLHLKWGEALAYAGKKDEAQKQFAIAAPLDLTRAEKAELAKARA